MPSLFRLTVVIGVCLLLVGGVGVAWGAYDQAADMCTSGQDLFIQHRSEPETGANTQEVVGFDSLSAVEQRIFLEAYTSDDNASRTYTRWGEWFDTERVVTYRGEQYATTIAVVDCGLPVGKLATFGGIASGVFGGGFLIGAWIWRRYP